MDSTNQMDELIAAVYTGLHEKSNDSYKGASVADKLDSVAQALHEIADEMSSLGSIANALNAIAFEIKEHR